MKKCKKFEDSETDSEFYIFEDDDLLPYMDYDPDQEVYNTMWEVLGSGTLREIDNNKTILLNNGKING